MYKAIYFIVNIILQLLHLSKSITLLEHNKLSYLEQLEIINILGISFGSNRIFTLHVICESELPINGKKSTHKTNSRHNVLERCANIQGHKFQEIYSFFFLLSQHTGWFTQSLPFIQNIPYHHHIKHFSDKDKTWNLTTGSGNILR